MKADELKKAVIKIAGKEFPLKLNTSENEHLQSIETEINNRISQYQSNFGAMNQQDMITMVLISYAFELKDAQNNNDIGLLDQTLSQIESVLQSS